MSDRVGNKVRPAPIDLSQITRENAEYFDSHGRPKPGLSAYTGERYERDVASGRADRPMKWSTCPSSSPADKCPSHVSPGYRSLWRVITTTPASKPSKKNPYPRPRRRRSPIREICYECRCWLSFVDHMAFVAEHGDYRLEDGSLELRGREATTVRDAAEIIAAATRAFLKEQRALDEITGGLLEPFAANERTPQGDLLTFVRHCLARYGTPRPRREAMRTSTPVIFS